MPWTYSRTNEWVLGQIKTEISSLNTIRKRQLTYNSHINRTDKNLEKLIIQGRIEGKRGRGRPAGRGRGRLFRKACEILSQQKDSYGYLVDFS